MPEYTPNAKGPAPARITPETTDPAPIPADQVKPEDIGKLSIEYRDGQPVIVVSGGSAIPERISVVDSSGNSGVRFQAVSASSITSSSFNQYTFSRNDPVNFIDLNGN
ncbi:hypothetical protein ACFVH0_39850 [Streptomyces sp. NPDC127117]|uniref:hypothetical protein n=1 Tax=Streptomyces sp. NPDC127117 TaxID=3345368 RepID=UPI00362CC440